jgi:translation initiation factor IF-3
MFAAMQSLMVSPMHLCDLLDFQHTMYDDKKKKKTKKTKAKRMHLTVVSEVYEVTYKPNTNLKFICDSKRYLDLICFHIKYFLS